MERGTFYDSRPSTGASDDNHPDPNPPRASTVYSADSQRAPSEAESENVREYGFEAGPEEYQELIGPRPESESVVHGISDSHPSAYQDVVGPCPRSGLSVQTVLHAGPQEYHELEGSQAAELGLSMAENIAHAQPEPLRESAEPQTIEDYVEEIASIFRLFERVLHRLLHHGRGTDPQIQNINGYTFLLRRFTEARRSITERFERDYHWLGEEFKKGDSACSPNASGNIETDPLS